VDEVEPGTGSTRPVPISRQDFHQALRRLARDVRQEGSPPEAARALLEAGWEYEGDWVAETYRGHVFSLVPLEETALQPLEDATLRLDYLRWCERRGGGDCLALLTDGPTLRTDDRRTLALALAFSSVLDESQQALTRELLDMRAVLCTFVWTVGLYLMTWLAPELSTKAVAVGLTVALVAWLGVDALWGLVDGWATLATQAHRAHTFDALRAAGQQYAQEIGEDAARALVLAVAALSGRTAGELAARVRSLPGYALALAQGEVQGLRLALALEAVETTVVATPHGALTVVMLEKRRGGASSAAPAPRKPSITVVLRHRKGNLQVVLGNGQRWHLPRGKSPREIPPEDPVGDQLQEAVIQAAKQWSPRNLTPAEREAIDKLQRQGKRHRANQLEAQARGRWVETQVEERVKHLSLKWSRQGVDVVDPKTGYKYEVLSGTEDNLGRHGRRMHDLFFRMISF
jgi:hypothetical protein